MAKKKTSKNTRKIKKIELENSLPQNILPMGEHVEEDKNIYISQATYKEIHNFTKNKLTNESGGMLIGNVVEAFNKTNILIQGFVEAKYCEATPTTLKFTHETWEYVHKEIDDKYEDAQIVGWIHTHPDFGIFLSEYDKFIQENFFKEDHQVAYVVDPIQQIEGFYFWINGRIEKCRGFYIYDKTGEKIELETKEKEERKSENTASGGSSVLTYVLAGLLLITLILFGIVSSNLLKRIQILEERQENLVESANQNLGLLQQQIIELQGEVGNLKITIENAAVDADGIDITGEKVIEEEPAEDLIAEPAEELTEESIAEPIEEPIKEPAVEPVEEEPAAEPAEEEHADTEVNVNE